MSPLSRFTSPRSDGPVLFAHLFSAPLTQTAIDGTGQILPVDELDYQSERRILLKAINEAGKSVRFLSEHATVASFRRAIGCDDDGGRHATAGGCRILHFTGHGTEGKLTFEDRFGTLIYLTREDLRQHLKAAQRAYGNTGIQLVFVSACFGGGVADVFVDAGVPHVVSVSHNTKVLDHKAQEFAQTFYMFLLRGDVVSQAFDLAKKRLNISQDHPEEAGKFRLLPEGANHRVHVLEGVLAGSFVNETPPAPLNNYDTVTENFIGRAIETQHVYRHMVNRSVRCITITGQKCVGKTQVCLKACAYASERYVFAEFLYCRMWRAGRTDVRLSLEIGLGLQKPLGTDRTAILEALTCHLRARTAHLRRGDQSEEPRLLMVLDGCPPFLMFGDDRWLVGSFLERLLFEVPNLTVLVTTTSPRPDVPGRVAVPDEEVVVVGRLQPYSAAHLFAKYSPRALKPPELTGATGSASILDTPDPIRCFASSDIMRALDGHPGAIVALATRMGEYRNLLEMEHEILGKVVPELWEDFAYQDVRRASGTTPPRSAQGQHQWFSNGGRPMHPPPPARTPRASRSEEEFASVWGAAARAGSAGTGPLPAGPPPPPGGPIPWERFHGPLAQYFAARLPQAAFRPLGAADFQYFATTQVLWTGAHSPSRTRGLVSREQLLAFWQWFRPLVKCLRATQVWGTPKLYGFMETTEVKHVLHGCSNGTFLIRVSSRFKATLVVCHVRQHLGETPTVVFDAVKVEPTGRCICELEHFTREYPSLDKLVMSIKHLTHVYPDVPKEVVFGGAPPSPAGSHTLLPDLRADPCLGGEAGTKMRPEGLFYFDDGSADC